MPSPLWSYVSPGIPDHLFDRLPGIPLTKREVRVLLISFLRLKPDSVLWDIGAGTGTLTVEAGLLCPAGQVIAIERDEDVATLIRQNCDRFGVQNVDIIEGSAPECLQMLAPPDCVYVGGGRPIKAILKAVFDRLQPNGRLVATATNLETLYAISEAMSDLHLRNIEVVQSAVNRLEMRGTHQVLAALDPTFVLSGEKLD